MVVADEIRSLANKSAEAAKNTTALIVDSQRAVHRREQITTEAAASMNTVVGSINSTAEILKGITQQSGAQLEAGRVIGMEIEHVTEIVRTNSILSQESASKSADLFAQSRQLEASVSKLKFSQQNTSPL